jgi:integrase
VEEPTSHVQEKPPKSHNGTRTLILDPTTLATLATIRPTAKAALVSGYMFLGRCGQPLRPDNLSNRFNQLARPAGVRAIGPHQIRHLLASNLLNLGYGIPEVAERLGHDPATLMRYYTRINTQRRRQAAHDLAELVTPTAQLMT